MWRVKTIRVLFWIAYFRWDFCSLFRWWENGVHRGETWVILKQRGINDAERLWKGAERKRVSCPLTWGGRGVQPGAVAAEFRRVEQTFKMLMWHHQYPCPIQAESSRNNSNKLKESQEAAVLFPSAMDSSTSYSYTSKLSLSHLDNLSLDPELHLQHVFCSFLFVWMITLRSCSDEAEGGSASWAHPGRTGCQLDIFLFDCFLSQVVV